jgi:hypothetical protein
VKKQNTSRKDDASLPSFTQEELDEIVEEATIDTYGIDEERGSWVAYLEDELAFPFPVRVIGYLAQANGVDERGGMVKLRVMSEGAEYWVNLTDCELVDAGGEKNRNDLLLAAYRNWFSPGDNDLDYEEI